MRVPLGLNWNVSPTEARAIQRELAGRVSLEDAVDPERVTVVAGVDNGYVKGARGFTAYAAAVALTHPGLAHLETAIADRPVEFPYVPGLLSFREAPAILAALERLAVEPDVILFDGQGYAHPRRLGLASHLGVVLDRPTIGCAKSRLIGRYEVPPDEFGAWTPLLEGDEVIGAAVRTKPGHEPLFVSPGHRVSVETAVRITLSCARAGQVMPVPTQAAHDAVTNHTRPFRRRT